MAGICVCDGGGREKRGNAFNLFKDKSEFLN